AARIVTALRAALDAAETAQDAARALADAYRRFGTGTFALHRAFRLSADGALKPVSDEAEPLSTLVGYEAQKALLCENTESFLAGRSANNVLLYGDAGTGKSTCVRALLAAYPDSLLRMIELPKDRLGQLSQLADTLGRRRCRFLLFLDDLSFEEDETAYKQLKASIEGGLAALPENVRIYATSNRRHLVRETWKDRTDMEHDGDVHRSDTMEEKLSLSARFGLRIYFPNPSFQEYHAIVEELARRRGADGAAVRQAASAWQVRRGSRSGRTAKQFVDDYLGRPDRKTDDGGKRD
ncbi:MAG: ATP-binding protein, partial [Oscillospiraceae bacterium]|nr:ATP-binding protein [Oscillospiraceae bacterium]